MWLVDVTGRNHGWGGTHRSIGGHLRCGHSGVWRRWNAHGARKHSGLPLTDAQTHDTSVMLGITAHIHTTPRAVPCCPVWVLSSCTDEGRAGRGAWFEAWCWPTHQRPGRRWRPRGLSEARWSRSWAAGPWCPSARGAEGEARTNGTENAWSAGSVWSLRRTRMKRMVLEEALGWWL